MKLEFLQKHLSICEYNLDAVIVCDKGCNLRMTRREYLYNCFLHLKDRVHLYEKENKKLSHRLIGQRERHDHTVKHLKQEIKSLNDEVSRQKEQIAILDVGRHQKEIPRKEHWDRTLKQLKQEVAKIADEAICQNEQITKLKISRQQEVVLNCEHAAKYLKHGIQSLNDDVTPKEQVTVLSVSRRQDNVPNKDNFERAGKHLKQEVTNPGVKATGQREQLTKLNTSRRQEGVGSKEDSKHTVKHLKQEIQNLSEETSGPKDEITVPVVSRRQSHVPSKENCESTVKHLKDEITIPSDEATRQKEQIPKLNASRRSDYVSNKENCEHTVKQLKQKITKHGDKTSLQKERMTKLNVSRRQEDFSKKENCEGTAQHPKQEILSHGDDANRPKLNAASRRQKEESRDSTNSLSAPLKWRMFDNMRIDSTILQPEDVNLLAFAESFYPLNPTYSSFKIEILSLSDVTVGLVGEDRSQWSMPCVEYRSNGSIFFGVYDISHVNNECGHKFQVGDIIECGVIYPLNFTNSGIMDRVVVYFSHNGQLLIERFVAVPPSGFFPRIFMCGESKVKYLSN